MCLVCGLKNPYGLKTSFYELENNELVSIFKLMELDQKYLWLHGGITTAFCSTKRSAAVTYALRTSDVGRDRRVHYKIQEGHSSESRAALLFGRITNEEHPFLRRNRQLSIPEVAATGVGKYIKLPLEKIADFDATEQAVARAPRPHLDPKAIELREDSSPASNVMPKNQEKESHHLNRCVPILLLVSTTMAPELRPDEIRDR